MSNIVLTGPVHVGKTTVAKMLAKRLDREFVSMHQLMWHYYSETGDDSDMFHEKRKEGLWELYQYLVPYAVRALERIVSDYEDAVIDLESNHAVFEGQKTFERAQRALTGHQVIHLIPSIYITESLNILKERTDFNPETAEKDMAEFIQLNTFFMQHHSNHDLATLVVYTKDKTPDDTCAEIIERLGL
jgi:shikimate kinase